MRKLRFRLREAAARGGEARMHHLGIDARRAVRRNRIALQAECTIENCCASSICRAEEVFALPTSAKATADGSLRCSTDSITRSYAARASS